MRLHVRSATVTALYTWFRALVMKTGDLASFPSAHPDALHFVENLIDSYPATDLRTTSRAIGSGLLRLPLSQQPSAESRRRLLSGENCTVLLTDVVGLGGFTATTGTVQMLVRRSALEIMRTSLGVHWDKCIPEDRGDGHLIVVPPTVRTARIIGAPTPELPAQLRMHNHYVWRGGAHSIAGRHQCRAGHG